MTAFLGGDRFDIDWFVQETVFHRGGQILQAAPPYGDGRDHGNAQGFSKLGRIERQPVPFRQVHHVERHHDRLAERDHFEREAQMVIEIGGVEHQDDRIGPAFAILQPHDDAARHFFIRAGRIKAVAAGQIDQFRRPAVGKGEMP